LFVDAARTTHIEGLHEEESAWLLDFLNKHIAFGQDFQARVKWEAGAVAVWDQVRVLLRISEIKYVQCF
jgi:sulfonate dioxygenase